MMPTIDINALLNMGMAGVVLGVIVVPLLRWLLHELTAQRLAFGQFIEGHSQKELQVLAQLETSLALLTTTMSAYNAQLALLTTTLTNHNFLLRRLAKEDNLATASPR